jgi:hypothetical protein
VWPWRVILGAEARGTIGTGSFSTNAPRRVLPCAAVSPCAVRACVPAGLAAMMVCLGSHALGEAKEDPLSFPHLVSPS